jgi:hypothetical protein
MDLALKDQEEWRRLFLSGDKRACTISVNDQSNEWTSIDVRWYIGDERGYVSNADK